MKAIFFIFDCVLLLYYNRHKMNFKCGGSQIDSPDWIKNKNATKSSIYKKGNKLFQYTPTVALNHEEIREHTERRTTIKSFINKYNWGGRIYLSENIDWRKFEKNYVAIAFNILYAKKEKAYSTYVS